MRHRLQAQDQAYAAVQHFLEKDLTGNAARMEKHLQVGGCEKKRKRKKKA